MPTPPTNFPGYRSGDFSSPRKISQSPREYPFAKLGDITSYTYKKFYAVDILAFTPTARGTADPDNSSAYLMLESVPEIQQGRLATFFRVYGTVPSSQVDYLTMPLNKPDPWQVMSWALRTGTFSYQVYYPDKDSTSTWGNPSGYTGPKQYAVAFSSTIDFAPDGYIYRYQSCSTPTLTVATGGTFTLTYNGSTTAAIAYNASSVTIEGAINALASVVSEGLTFAAANNLNSAGVGILTLTATVGTPGYRFTASSSITPTAASTLHIWKKSATVQIVAIATRLALTAHGFDTTKRLYLSRNNGYSYALLSGFWSAPDANTLAWYETSPATITGVGQPLRAYTPGNARVRVRTTQSFNRTVGNLSLVSPKTADVDLLTLAAATATGYQDYDCTDVSHWQDSDVYTQTVTAINVDNLG